MPARGDGRAIAGTTVGGRTAAHRGRWSRRTASKRRRSSAFTNAAASSKHICCWCGPCGFHFKDTARGSAIQSTVIFFILVFIVVLVRRRTQDEEEDARLEA